jgi:uncharacterized ferredoxin-like protein
MNEILLFFYFLIKFLGGSLITRSVYTGLHTCYNGRNKKKLMCKHKQFSKNYLSPKCMFKYIHEDKIVSNHKIVCCGEF